MPSGAEILKDHQHRIKELEEKVRLLEARVDKMQETDWSSLLEEDIDLDEPAPPSRHTGAQPDPAQVNEDAGVVEITPPTRTQRKFREKWLPRIGLENLPAEWGLSKEEADAAYVEGGPVWLYLAGAGFTEEQKSGRDYILSLPEDVRRAMVNDLQLGEISPRWIQEFGRDILKDEGDSRRAAEVFAEATAGGYRMPGVG